MQSKAEPYISQYLHSKGAKLGLPITGNFELTPRCNFNCKMCYVHLTDEEIFHRGKEMTANEWLEIAEASKAQGTIFLLLTGGEPFIRSDFITLYAKLKKMGFMISINSNGSLIEGRNLEHILKDPPYRLNITLYGGSNESYERLCGRPLFDRVLKNIDILCKAGISVRLNVSLTPYNQMDLDRIYAIANERRLQVRATAYMNPPIRIKKDLTGTNQNRFSPEEAAINTIRIDRLRYSDEEFYSRAEKIRQNILEVEDEGCQGISGEKMYCRAGKSSYWITWDGRMLPCGMLTEPSVDVRGVGFLKAWEKVKLLTDKILLPSECISCENKKVCNVCAAMCQSETGFFNKKPEYICRMTQALLEKIEL